MQNKPNLGQSQVFITRVSMVAYSEKMKLDTWSNQTQSNPISEESKMSLTHYMTREYENKSGLLTIEKQTQFMVSGVESTCGENGRINFNEKNYDRLRIDNLWLRWYLAAT